MEVKFDLAKIDGVIVGRILAGVIVILSFAYSVKAATEAISESFWVFLITFTEPLALAFVIIMAAEIVRSLRNR